ncbi:hypothetical protein FXO38_34314 [Capsicum annuum]|nr:hypothetical protein FXO37_35239 [Capsicum annuum]KAF3616802.1 hypothetical protein FXO38_34314 [Capsicum annuum]
MKIHGEATTVAAYDGEGGQRLLERVSPAGAVTASVAAGGDSVRGGENERFIGDWPNLWGRQAKTTLLFSLRVEVAMVIWRLGRGYGVKAIVSFSDGGRLGEAATTMV